MKEAAEGLSAFHKVYFGVSESETKWNPGLAKKEFSLNTLLGYNPS
jgi:hypothetical protein